jgi:hypothetical protein
MSTLYLQDLSEPSRAPVGPLPLSQAFTIGRNETSDLTINQAVVSGVHCKLALRGGSLILTDLSSNGTFLNGVKVGKGKDVEVKVGDVVQIARPRGYDQDFAAKFKLIALTHSSVPIAPASGLAVPPRAAQAPGSGSRTRSSTPVKAVGPGSAVKAVPVAPGTPNKCQAGIVGPGGPAVPLVPYMSPAKLSSYAPQFESPMQKSPALKRARGACEGSPLPLPSPRASISGPIATIGAAEMKVQELQTLADSLSTQVSDVSLQLQFKTRRLEEVERQHREALSKMESLTERCGALETQTQSWEFKAAQLQSAVERLKGEAGNSRGELSSCVRERDELRGACEEWRELAERNKVVVSELGEKRRELETYVRELESSTGKYQTLIAGVNERNAELVFEKAKLMETVGDWESRGREWEGLWRGVASWLRICPVQNLIHDVVQAERPDYQAPADDAIDESPDTPEPDELTTANGQTPKKPEAALFSLGDDMLPINAFCESVGVVEVAMRRVTEGGSVIGPAESARRDSAPRHSSGTQLEDEGESCELMDFVVNNDEELPDFLGAIPGTFAGGFFGGESVQDNHSVAYM